MNKDNIVSRCRFVSIPVLDSCLILDESLYNGRATDTSARSARVPNRSVRREKVNLRLGEPGAAPAWR